MSKLDRPVALHSALRHGAIPCRFCGLDWLWRDTNGAIYRHDPLKMAGVKTQQGQMRHAMRGLNVAMTRDLWLPLIGVISRAVDVGSDVKRRVTGRM